LIAIVRHFRKPTFFIIFTANLWWPEIDRELKGRQPIDQLDLIAYVFYLKVRELLVDLKNSLFSLYIGHVYIIKY
jgi:hypothetical protein